MDNTNRSAFKRVKRITSYSGHARYRQSLNPDGYHVGWIPRQPITSPYAYSPTHEVIADPKHGNVIMVETSHKRYDVFAVPDDVTIYASDDEAMNVYLYATTK